MEQTFDRKEYIKNLKQYMRDFMVSIGIATTKIDSFINGIKNVETGFTYKLRDIGFCTNKTNFMDNYIKERLEFYDGCFMTETCKSICVYNVEYAEEQFNEQQTEKQREDQDEWVD